MWVGALALLMMADGRPIGGHSTVMSLITAEARSRDWSTTLIRFLFLMLRSPSQGSSMLQVAKVLD